MDSKKFAIFGDCVSQGILDNREHTRALGFINWISLISNPVKNENVVKAVDEIDVSHYTARNLRLDLSKEALNYLLEEKAYYLLIDPNDCRKELVVSNDDNSESVYTITEEGGSCIIKRKKWIYFAELMLQTVLLKNMKKQQKRYVQESDRYMEKQKS